jgi:hypothetical protein
MITCTGPDNKGEELTRDGLLYGMTRYFRETVLVIPDLIRIDLCPMKAIPVKLEELSNK